MNAQKLANIDGLLAYLKPKGEDWEPLTDKALLLLNNRSDSEDGSLSDEEKKKLTLAKQQISDILLKSLQLPNLSFFAGSGTSLAEVKGPSMWDLWRKSMWLEPDSTEDVENIKVLKTEAQAVMDKVRYNEVEKPNIEHFLSQCDAYLLFNTEDETVKTFVNAVKKTILHECSSFLDHQDCNISSYENLLQKMARRRVRDPRLKVFTTNYDMCFETAASNLGMMVVDGFFPIPMTIQIDKPIKPPISDGPSFQSIWKSETTQ